MSGKARAAPLSPEDLALLESTPRPRTRGECREGPRPCPWYGCRHHLGLQVMTDHTVRVHIDPEEDTDRDTCALDVAERDGLELVDVFLQRLMGDASRQAIQQGEARAKRRARPLLEHLVEEQS
jgi:hypothetical protein